MKVFFDADADTPQPLDPDNVLRGFVEVMLKTGTAPQIIYAYYSAIYPPHPTTAITELLAMDQLSEKAYRTIVEIVAAASRIQDEKLNQTGGPDLHWRIELIAAFLAAAARNLRNGPAADFCVFGRIVFCWGLTGGGPSDRKRSALAGKELKAVISLLAWRDQKLELSSKPIGLRGLYCGTN
jgi:hypothetical protein